MNNLFIVLLLVFFSSLIQFYAPQTQNSSNENTDTSAQAYKGKGNENDKCNSQHRHDRNTRLI